MSAATAKNLNCTRSLTHVNPFPFGIEIGIAHGATGKGNDQVRFELSYYALKPGIYATEEAYKLVKAGTPFRDAYRKVAEKFAKSS